MADKAKDDTADSMDILAPNLSANVDGNGMDFAHSVRHQTASRKYRFGAHYASSYRATEWGQHQNGRGAVGSIALNDWRSNWRYRTARKRFVLNLKMSLCPKRSVISIVSTVPQNGADQKEEDVDSKAVQQSTATKTDQRANARNGTELEPQSLSICSRAEPPKFASNSTDSLSLRYRLQLILSPIYGLCGALTSRNRLHCEMSPKCSIHQIPRKWGFGQNSDSFWFHRVFTMKMMQTLSLCDDVRGENTQKYMRSLSLSVHQTLDSIPMTKRIVSFWANSRNRIPSPVVLE